MGCFPCFGGGGGGGVVVKQEKDNVGSNNGKHEKGSQVPAGNRNIQAQSFTFPELASATNGFKPDSLLGEGGFGKVYKGCLEISGQIVAVKELDKSGLQESREFLVEVLMLSLLHHPNLVNLVGYCADGDQMLLVHEYIPNGSLQDHLTDLKPNQEPLCWYTRMRIAFGAAQGLEYLHDKANPPVIYRELKSSNILLDELLTPKLSDFGVSKLRDKPAVLTSMNGYCAPECCKNGEASLKSDVYSFGVVLLELITGRRAFDASKPTDEQNLVSWAKPMVKDQKKYRDLADPILQGDYPIKSLNQAVAVASMCLQDEPSVRPLMADVVMTLSFLIEGPPIPQPSPKPSPDKDDCVVETLQLGQRSNLSSRLNKEVSKHERHSSDQGI